MLLWWCRWYLCVVCDDMILKMMWSICFEGDICLYDDFLDMKMCAMHMDMCYDMNVLSCWCDAMHVFRWHDMHMWFWYDHAFEHVFECLGWWEMINSLILY